MNQGYPLKNNLFDVEHYTRRRPSGQLINLKSCEFLHPDITKILENIGQVRPEEIQYYPYPEETKIRLAERLNIPFKNITLSAGSDPIISIIVDSLTSITKRMILQTPNYFGWHNYAALREIEVIPFIFGNPKPHIFSINVLIKIIKSTPPSLVVLSNPNSPTGFLLSIDEIKEISTECARYNHLLVIDECFSEFSGIDHYKALGDQEHIIFVKSFSKALGLAGVRIALTIASPKITLYLAKWNPESAVSGSALHFLEDILNHEDKIKKLRDDIIHSKEEFIKEVLKLAPTWSVIPSGANFVTFFLSHDNPTHIAAALLKFGYYVRDVSMLPGLRSCIRFGIASGEIMSNLLRALRSIFEKSV